jgi:uncharacterized protein YkwD
LRGIGGMRQGEQFGGDAKGPAPACRARQASLVKEEGRVHNPEALMRRSLIIACLVVCSCAWVATARQEKGKTGDGPESPKLGDVEKQFIDMTNVERKKHNLPPVKVSPLLTKVARAHAANMARQEKALHELDGKSPFQRLKEAKYRYLAAGENIAFRPDDLPLKVTMEKWMDSPPHRKNILDAEFTEIGLGAASSKDGTVYITQLFGTPKETEKRD